ncbi:PREDICTED: 28S ribosomal protein S29, mitochondrial [Atta cephalotes]|uniref:Small ribosomal subunit protein mS29 n=1 Tax=Atta cephalotes TaxID=12957 RepID=A0A158NZQ6_ATTCE|nr:PREDICTED: 28S ribosomal protein S29, mitochondrial [Atta cephalotes]
MSLRSYSLLRGIYKTYGRKFGTAIKVNDEQMFQACLFRTTENNPVNHNTDHIARLYTIPKNIQQQLFQYGGLPRLFMKQVTTFQECAILIRQPAIEVISYLSQTDYTKPVNKYVLYGKFGTGKSIILSHILHYAFMQNYLLVHIYWGAHWFKDMKEVATSEFFPGCMDLPIDAGMWLRQFKTQNSKLLSQLDLKMTKDYVWNQRETTSQGTHILELIDFGINRMKYACGVVDALIKEIKLASTAGKCKTMVMIDGFNAFTADHTRIFDDNKKMVLPKQVSLAIPFLDITKDDWCNGAIVLSVDEKANKEQRDSYLPRYLLGKEGFEHLDPFVPIVVDDYNSAEFDSIIEYYKDRKWIRNITPSGQRELELVTNKNPLILIDYCKFL